MSVAMAATPRGYEQLRKACIWIAPAIAIPSLRYTQDNRGQRNELFVRDASTYTIGAAIYYVGELVAKKVLMPYQQTLSRFRLLNNNHKLELAAFLVGLSANLLYAGIGAVHVSHAIARRQARNKENKIKTTALNQNAAIQASPLNVPIQSMGAYPFPRPASSLIYPLSSFAVYPGKQVQYLA